MEFKNESEVRTWLNETENEDNLDEGDIRRAFVAVYGRLPESDEDAISLVYAGV
jgi:hypothetical protein